MGMDGRGGLGQNPLAPVRSVNSKEPFEMVKGVGGSH